MSFTYDQNLELLATGQADWDVNFNANMAIMERGRTLKAIAASAISSGQVCAVNSVGGVYPYDVRSAIGRESLIAFQSANSGDASHFLVEGTVRSMAIWSAFLTPGLPVFTAINSPGFVVSSYAGCGEAVGLAVAKDAIIFSPGQPRVLPGFVSIVTTTAIVGALGNATFAIPIGARNSIYDLVVQSNHDRFKVRFWSGSSRVNSELEYETLTRSYATGSADVGSTYFRDRATFPHINTDASTSWMIYGRVDAQQGSSVTSGYFGITILAERFK